VSAGGSAAAFPGVGRWTALGTTSSRPKFSSAGVYLVDSWREVLRANISSGRRASHFFWSASQNWATIVFRVLFVLSTGFAWGVYGGVSRCTIPSSWRRVRNVPPEYCVPLYEITVTGHPNQVMTSSYSA
jgi:hypothetical protein